MRNIWTVFKTDIKSLSKCFFACAVAVAIAILPSLYAWLNIYSNWDPYGNTGGISIAVASLDQGYTDEDGVYTNKGANVVADLREATSIHWVPVESDEAAREGVYAGDYYAAVVIGKDFTSAPHRVQNLSPSLISFPHFSQNGINSPILITKPQVIL